MDHLSDAQFTAFRMRRLDPSDLLAVDNHLSVCSDCRRKLLALHAAATIPSFFAALGSPHPTYEELKGYIEGRTAGERVLLHVQICPQCKAEVDGLEGFRDPAATRSRS